MYKHQFEQMMRSKGFKMDTFGFFKEVEIRREVREVRDLIYVRRHYLDKSVRYFLLGCGPEPILHNLEGGAVLAPNAIMEYYLWGYPVSWNHHRDLVEEIKNYEILE